MSKSMICSKKRLYCDWLLVALEVNLLPDIITDGSGLRQQDFGCAPLDDDWTVDALLTLSLSTTTTTRTYKGMAPFNLDACIEQLMRKQLLHEALLREICEKTKEVLMRESNVVHVSAPVTVVGDIHG